MHYFGAKGNTYYIIDSDNDIAYAFDGFGKVIESLDAKMAICRLGGKQRQVDCISFLGRTLDNESVIYFMDSQAVVPKGYMAIYKDLRTKLPVQNGLVFRIPRVDLDANLMQVILPLKTNSLSVDGLSELLGGVSFKKI